MLTGFCKRNGRLLPKIMASSKRSHLVAFRQFACLLSRQLELEDNSKIPNHLKTSDTLLPRHLGPTKVDEVEMIKEIGCESVEDMLTKTVPSKILTTKLADMFSHKFADIKRVRSEFLYLHKLKHTASKNKIMKSFQGQGFYPNLTPNVILRNVLENPNWYTPYTPYQAEISQGRLENLLNFQTMITDLTGLEIANASLLDEATAGAEAMFMCFSNFNKKRNVFFVSDKTFTHTIEVIKTRAEPLGIKVVVGNPSDVDFSTRDDIFGVLVQNPDLNGNIVDWKNKADEVHKAGAYFVIGADILSLTLSKTPGEMGADITFGNTQRFGVPMGFGGPHAAFFACKSDIRYRMPGRVIGVSIDHYGKRAYRMSMQTREQHIRRDRATSNICTAQALLANMAAFYGIWHGPSGLTNIAQRVNHMTHILHDSVSSMGYNVITDKRS